MLKHVIQKISSSKLHLHPFPHLVIKNFLPAKTLSKLNKILPSFDDADSENVMFQSTSNTKKTIMPDSKIFKTLMKKQLFKEANLVFKKIKPEFIKKFKKHIEMHVNYEFQKSKIKYHMNFAIMKRGYLKSAHLDRRDHMMSAIYYPDSEKQKGGNLQLCRLKKKQKVFDVFPSERSLIISKDYKIEKNLCVVFLNVPWSYHAVKKYEGLNDRKYFYIDYDFETKNSAGLSKNRKKGSNLNSFWKSQVKVKSLKRKEIFFSE